MSHFLLTTRWQPETSYEIVPQFLFAAATPTPLRNTNDVAVFFDGFFSNLTELRRHLNDSTFTPEELLAALYINNSGFDAINGHFCAVIVDLQRRTLLGITDRQCVGELYYHVAPDGTLALTSDFARLLPFSSKHLNEYALSCFFSLGDIDRQDTFLKDIRRITEFYTLHFDGALAIKADYLAALLAIPVDSDRLPREVLEHLDQLLTRNTASLTTDAGQLCNTLSGGVDSSYLQALLLRHNQRHSFSIAFDSYGIDNRYAGDVAYSLGTTHESITFPRRDLVRYIERGVKLTRKPYMNQGELMFLKLYDHIAQRFPDATIVSGQTADAALASKVPRAIELALQSHMPYEFTDLLLGLLSADWGHLAAALKGQQISSHCIQQIDRKTAMCNRVGRYLGWPAEVYTEMADMVNRSVGNTEDRIAKAYMYAGEKRRIPNVLAALARSVGLRIAMPFLDPKFFDTEEA
jgi:asparagine synthetase B (glutamine-hydrolysing)